MNCMRLDFVSIFKAEDQNGIDRGRQFRWNVTDVAELAVLLYGVRIWAGSKDDSFKHDKLARLPTPEPRKQAWTFGGIRELE